MKRTLRVTVGDGFSGWVPQYPFGSVRVNRRLCVVCVRVYEGSRW